MEPSHFNSIHPSSVHRSIYATRTARNSLYLSFIQFQMDKSCQFKLYTAKYFILLLLSYFSSSPLQFPFYQKLTFLKLKKCQNEQDTSLYLTLYIIITKNSVLIFYLLFQLQNKKKKNKKKVVENV